jgi:phage-related protein
MSEIGRIVGVLQVRDEATEVIGKFNSAAQGLFGTMKDLGGSIGTVGGIAEAAFGGFATGGPVGAALGAGTAAVGAFVTGIQSCVKEATASEAVWASLGAAVERSGGSWQTLKKGTEDALGAMSRTTTYSDEQLAPALEKLMTFGLSYDQAMKALGGTIDLAAAKHMSLETASTIVGKSLDGNAGILKRYGVDVTSSKDAVAALKDAHDTAKTAIEGMGKGVDAWVISVSAAIEASPEFEAGLAGAKDKAGYLIDQFQQGNIDLPQFTEAMTSLGVPLDEAKLKAGSAEGVLDALNKQFGGAAQAAASTYAGTQERLKNATGEVAEKIGTMFLPALANLTEGMIPIVEGFGKGVDAVGAWLTEVGKMPEVKGLVEAAQGAFDGLWKGMQDFWGFLTDTFGPVLKELGDAFGEIFDALAPIGQALGDVWAAITGGQEGGNWLKDFLKFVAQFIGDVVVPAIKDAVPFIKGFADAFKAAADFALPIITTIKDAVVGFIEALKTTFQGFYNWLVGKSLWTDMWNQLTTIAGQMIGTLLGELGTKLFEPIKNAFTGAMQAVEDLWGKGWDAIQTAATTIWDAVTKDVGPWIDGIKTSIGTTMDGLKTGWETTWNGIQTGAQTIWDTVTTNAGTWIDGVEKTVSDTMDATKTAWDTNWGAVKTTLDTLMPQIQTNLNTALDGLKSALSTSTGTYGPTMTSALGGMQSAMNTGFALVKGDWQGALDNINGALSQWGTAAKGVMDGIMGGLQGAVQTGLDTIKGGWDTFVGALQSGVGTLQSALDSAGGSVQDTLDAVGSATEPATSTVTTAFTDAFDTISTAATGFWNWLTGHSLWPEMLDRMSGVTRDKLLDIASTFSKVFGSIEQELSNRFQNMFEGTKGAMGMILQVIASSLTEIRDNFMSTIRDVEASWSDAWTEINRVAATTTQQILGGLTTWWSMLQANFMTGLTAIRGAWQTSWTFILETVANICGQIGAGLTMWFAQVTALFTMNLTMLQTNWQTSWMQMGVSFQAWLEQTQNNLVSFFDNYFVPKWQSGLGIVQSLFATTFATMVSTAESSMASIVSTVASALAQVQAMAAQMAGLLSSAMSMENQAAALGAQAATTTTATVTTATSPWPRSPFTGDLLATWIDAMRQMNANLANIPYPYQTRLGEFKEVRETGLGLVHKGEVIGRPTGLGSITLQNQVIVDGAIVAKTVEQRLISQRQLVGS